MEIEKFVSHKEQVIRIGKQEWSVARLIFLAKDLPVLEIPLDHLYVCYWYENINLRSMVSHMKAVLAADLQFPIILDEDGELLDGRHRVMKAMLEGAKTIKAVRFDVNPDACLIRSE